MKKRLLSAALALLLCCSVASAAGNGKGPGTGNGFQHKHQYQQYADVAGHWCEPYAKSCMETGLMQGVGNGFAPGGIVSNAEVAVVAARIRETLTGEAIALPTAKQGETVLWYQGYLDYLTAAGVTGLGIPTETATRGSFVSVFSQVLPDETMKAINQITALPDTKDPEVLRCYNAGILTGTDAYGTFHAQGQLTRGELAAMVARITDQELRKTFVPKEKPAKSETPSIAREVLGVEPETTILTVGTTNVSAEEYALTLVQFVLDEENAQLWKTGLGLDWNASYEVGDLNDYFKQLATNEVVGNLFYAAKCKELGCKPEELAGKFSTKAGLDAFIKDNDLLRAKHILIPSADLNSGTPLPKEEAEKALTLAKTILAMVQADPSEGNFDKLMKEFSKDGGTAKNPNGYVFTKDEMVPPFEKGTRALEIGKISGLVKSDFGYHIILRLDPALDQNVISGYQRKTLNDGLAVWLKTNEVRSTPLYVSLDAQTLFTKALPILQAAGT